MSVPPNGTITNAMMTEWGMSNNGSDSPIATAASTVSKRDPRKRPHDSNSTSQQQPKPTKFSSTPPPPILAPVKIPDVPQIKQEDAMRVHEQSGSVVLGPGSHKEAVVLGMGLAGLTRRAQEELSKAKKYAMEQSVRDVLMKQTLAHQQQQQKMAMYAQALSLMARVYVGSISFELREESVKQAFSVFGPIKSVNMSWDPITGHHKGFAFLEYEIPEGAMLAQEQMNGVLIGGRNIKVARPTTMSQAQPIIDMITEDAKKYNRVYVASIHPDLSENDIKCVFEAFGKIRCIELAKGPAQGKHGGYAFIEYETEKGAVDAVASMNLFDLGGQFLRVGRAVTPPQAKEYSVPAANSTLPTAAAVAAAAVTAKIQAMDASITQQPPITPTIVVGNTPPASSFIGLGPIFAVPPPGIAIPQISSRATIQPVVVTTPQLYSVQSTSSASSLLPGSSSAVKAGTSTVASTAFQLNQSPAPLAVAPTFVRPPAAPVPAITVRPASTSQTINAGQQPKQQPMNSIHIAATSVQTASSVGQSNAAKQETEASQTLAAQEDIKIKGSDARNMLMHKLMRRTESCVLVLRNMVGPEDVDDTLHDEVAEECSKYGRVEQVIIYQERRGEGEFATGIVKIFVKYALAQEADTAKNGLDGRFFNGRQIKAQIYDQNLFEHQDLSA